MKNTYAIRLEKLMQESVEELKAVNICPASNIMGIKPNSRAKKRLGCCKKILDRGKVIFEIEISTMMEQETDRAVKEVILHELLHTCSGCLNHGQKWKSLAAEVNRVYGYNITTTAEIVNADAETKTNRCRYEIRCMKCGNVGYRMKKSKVISHPEDYRCGKCGGRLEIKEKSF